MKRAHRSFTGSHIECGFCGATLCRRERIDPPTVRDPGYYLSWGDGWREVDDHIERAPKAVERLERGNPPNRRDWLNAERLALTRALRRFVPAKCDECGELNEITRKRLDVIGIIAHHG